MLFLAILFVSTTMTFSCGEANKNNDKTQKSEKSPTLKKIDELLTLLSASLFDECYSLPMTIESPFEEFPNASTKGGLFFDGEKREFNKQYSFYSTKRDLYNNHLSWTTQQGSIDNIEIITYKDEYNKDAPFLKADWTSDDGKNTAEVRISGVFNNKEAPESNGTIQYALFTKYWKVIGYRKVAENEFYAIIQKMGEIKGVDFSKLKIVKPPAAASNVAPRSAINNSSSMQGKFPQASERLLTSSDLSGMSKKDLKIMKNEIFARKGYIFKTAEMKSYFANQSWYSGQYDDVTLMLSAEEKQNVEIIKKYE